jgi:hypothetical protein
VGVAVAVGLTLVGGTGVAVNGMGVALGGTVGVGMGVGGRAVSVGGTGVCDGGAEGSSVGMHAVARVTSAISASK